jgi:hypothetical protein
MIKTAAQSSILNDTRYTSMSGGNLPSNEYLIQTATMANNNVSEVIFDVSSFSNIYKHLKIITSVRGTGGLDGYNVQFNGDTGTNYAAHLLYSNGSSVLSAAATSANFFSIGLAAPFSETDVYCVSETDILDPFNSTKNTTARVQVGIRTISNPFVQIRSGAWFNTTPVSSIRIYANSGSFAINSRFSIYGVTA